jgi:glutathione synthase/RimK-type ligase-like ATP-grasp enzyme
MKAVENVFIAPPISDPTDSVLLYTALVTTDELREADPSDFAGPPFILQAYVDKDYEVRLIMFDGEALAYRIESQASEKGSVDWRLDDDAPVEAMAVPEDIRLLCFRYLSEAGLNYGAFDFCVDQRGKWIFLECNAEGQWAWLEGKDQELSRMFARQFLKLISA